MPALIRVIFVLFLLGMTPGYASNHAEETADPLVAIEELRQTALQSDAPLLSPKNWSRGNDSFQRARNTDKQDKQDKLLNEARNAFSQAIAQTRVAQSALADAIAARNAAQLVSAAKLAEDNWKPAEKAFTSAIEALENGKAGTAEKKQQQASDAFRIAELNAIRTFILGDAWRLLAEADQKRTAKFAPITLARATALADRSNAMLLENRYDTREPALLANEAAQEARHALYIAETAQSIRNDEKTVETLILEWEKALAEVAQTVGIPHDFSAGPEATVTDLQDAIETTNAALRQTERDLRDRDALVIGLEEEIRDLDDKLANVSSDRSSLVRQIAEQARTEEQFEQVQALFSSDEADVIKNGDSVILRLIGLRFASNSAALDANSKQLLAKIERAIEIYPQCTLAVEGHTDSQGGAQPNLILSEQRAQAVRSYLIDTLRIAGYRITGKGYGDTRPIANNKSAEGRSRNRRIDLIITP